MTTGLGTLEDLTGAPVLAAAPPFGAYTPAVLRFLRDTGFTEIHSCRGGYAITGGPLRARVAVSNDGGVNAGILALSRRPPGARDWVRGQWHRIQDGSVLPGRRAYRRLASASAAS